MSLKKTKTESITLINNVLRLALPTPTWPLSTGDVLEVTTCQRIPEEVNFDTQLVLTIKGVDYEVLDKIAMPLTAQIIKSRTAYKFAVNTLFDVFISNLVAPICASEYPTIPPTNPAKMNKPVTKFLEKLAKKVLLPSPGKYPEEPVMPINQEAHPAESAAPIAKHDTAKSIPAHVAGGKKNA